MDGATFLSQARVLHRDAVLVPLAGQIATQPAVQAVNEGQIYRRHHKPCTGGFER